jgi:UDPglucose 6-dehydrogenase
VLASTRLRFTTEIAEGISQADVVLVAVGTPPHVDGSPDLTALRSVTLNIAQSISPGAVVAIKSTIPVGAASKMQTTFDGLGAVDIGIVRNPEFLSEGSTIRDFFHPNHIVVGTISDRARKVMRELYACFLAGGSQIEIGFGIRGMSHLLKPHPRAPRSSSTLRMPSSRHGSLSSMKSQASVNS